MTGAAFYDGLLRAYVAKVLDIEELSDVAADLLQPSKGDFMTVPTKIYQKWKTRKAGILLRKLSGRRKVGLWIEPPPFPSARCRRYRTRSTSR